MLLPIDLFLACMSWAHLHASINLNFFFFAFFESQPLGKMVLVYIFVLKNAL